MPGDKPRHEGLYISISQIKTYLRCPRQYQLHYVQGVPPAFIPIPLAFGQAFHSALAFYYAVIRDTNVPPSVDDIVDVFVAAWESAASGPIPLQVERDDDEAEVDHVEKGKQMLQAFHAYVAVAPKAQVVDVEKDFSVELHDPDTGELLEEKLVGVFDLVVREGDRNIVVEHKSAARRWTDDQLEYDIQVTGYQLAARQLGLGDVGLRYQVITKTKMPAVQVEDVRREAQAEDDFLRTAVGVLRAVDAGAFFPVRGWQCRTCAYEHACSTVRP